MKKIYEVDAYQLAEGRSDLIWYAFDVHPGDLVSKTRHIETGL
jgi:hypothetical protein